MEGNIIGVAQSYMYKVVTAAVILLVGFVLGILAKKLLKKILKEVELNKIMNKVGFTHDLESMVSSVISYVIYLVTVVIFLDYLVIRSIVIYILLGAILTLIVLTMLVGLKDVIPNFIGWLYLQKKRNLIEEGRKVDIKEISGKVEKIGYLETEIKTERGDILYVPNRLFMKSKFKIRKKD